MAMPGTSWEIYAKIWVGEAEGTTDVFWHYLYVAHITPRYSFEHKHSQTINAVKLIDYMG